MEQIDAAAENLARLATSIGTYKATVRSEADTRLKVIDPILIEVLGWPMQEISTEEGAGSGFLDYKLSVNGYARFVLEAKKDGRELGLRTRAAGRAYRIDGPVFVAPAIKEGIEQAIRYCGQKNAELACVTNGHEWVVLRGSRLGDGRDTMSGAAFIFTSLDDVQSKFSLFYDLLSYEAVKEFRYRSFFQEAEGRPIRSPLFRKALRESESRRPLPHDNLSGDLDRVMTSFFRRLSGDEDPDLLTNCFVVTKESRIADERLARISEDLVSKIRDVDTGSGEQLIDVVKRVKSTQRNEFVLIVGTKGSGKSTFIDRFFRHVLQKSLVDECVVAKVNLADSDGSEVSIATWLDQHLLEALERAIFQDEPPTYEELQGMFFDEYQRWSQGSLRPLYNRDKEEFKIEFGRHIEKRREERPHEYIQRLVAQVVRSRKKIPCIVFDNADHFTIEFQEKVFQYARSIYESELCLIIMPITDRTSWQLSREGALRSFESESLFLPTPSPQVVLQKRIEYLDVKLAEEKREPGRGYFLGRGISLSIDDLTNFTAALQAIFLRTGEASWWIGNFANRDIRRCLDIAKFLVTSPHLEVHELLKTYLADSSVFLPTYKVKRALVKGQYDIYADETHTFIRNIYAIEDELETSPLMGLRILRLLRDAQKSDSENPFVTLDQVLDYFRAMLIDATVTTAWLSRLLESALCLSYDPTVTDIDNARRLQISPAGFQHLRWGTGDRDYAQMMLEVTPLRDSSAYDRLVGLRKRPFREVWQEELEAFVDYLIAEDEKYCRVADHEAYTNQTRLASGLRRMIRDR
jgi:GTPase SAR1 family protein